MAKKMYRAIVASITNIIHALLLREIKTRFGLYRFGIVWALAEPLATVVVLSVIFGLRSRFTAQGVEFPIFIATGIIPFILFRTMITRGMTAITATGQFLKS
jgi:capsular polysaccharide transport system permease protein